MVISFIFKFHNYFCLTTDVLLTFDSAVTFSLRLVVISLTCDNSLSSTFFVQNSLTQISCVSERLDFGNSGLIMVLPFVV